MHRLCGQFNPHLDKMFYYIKIYSKNKLKKFKKKLKKGVAFLKITIYNIHCGNVPR